jgi:2-C-methyl-D-erythritol 4-phosphate cytidylyltransferase
MAIALIVAAGSGERLGADRPKALVELAGRTLVQWSVDVLRDVDQIERIVIALPPDTAMPSRVTGMAGITGAADVTGVAGETAASKPGPRAPVAVTAVDGGAVRSESVRLALAAAGGGPDSDLVVVHDAARPLVTKELVETVIAALACDRSLDGAIAAEPIADTVKRVSEGVVSETVDRSNLWAVQTPQVFRRAALERALDVPDKVLAQATDDAWLVQRAGGKIAVVRALSENLKVTTAQDLRLAEMLLSSRPA